MSVLNRLACSLGRRDEVPNQDLARDLAARRDRAAIRELAENLRNRDRSIRADCIKVIYEVGSLDPELIIDYAEDFVSLLHSKDNRLVWGGMTALAEVAKKDPAAVFKHVDEIKAAKETGSVITVDQAVAALSWTAAGSHRYNQAIFPYLLEHLAACRPKEVPQHAEKILPAVTAANHAAFVQVLEQRFADLSAAGQSRVRKIIKQANSL